MNKKSFTLDCDICRLKNCMTLNKGEKVPIGFFVSFFNAVHVYQ